MKKYQKPLLEVLELTADTTIAAIPTQSDSVVWDDSDEGSQSSFDV